MVFDSIIERNQNNNVIYNSPIIKMKVNIISCFVVNIIIYSAQLFAGTINNASSGPIKQILSEP